MAYIGAEPVPGQNREVDDISSSFNGSTTAFTIQVSGVNVSPESANNILVNLGGVLQNPGTDYTIAASTLTFTTAPASGLSFFALVLGAGINTATVADDTIGPSKLINTAVTAGSYTTADITVDAQGRITAAASGTISGAEIADQAVTNAKVNNSAAIAGTKISPDFGSQAISTTGGLSINGATVFNESGADVDFRIEGDTDANLFHVDAGNDRIGISTSTPDRLFTLDASATTRMNIKSGSSSTAGIEFGDSDDFNAGFIVYDNSDNSLAFGVNGSGEKVRIASNGGLCVNSTSADNNVHIGITSSSTGIILKAAGDHHSLIDANSNRSSAGNTLHRYLGRWNGTQVASMAFVTGSDTTNKDDGVITFSTSSADNLAEKMRLTSDGKLGIGITSPSTAMHIRNTDDPVTITLQNSDSNTPTNSGGEILFKGTKTNGDPILFGGVGGRRRNQASDVTGYLALYRQNGDGSNASQEALRIRHDGEAIFSNLGSSPSNSVGGISLRTVPSDLPTYIVTSSAQHAANAYTHYEFFNSNGSVGSILTNGNGTAFNTSSDYRLKENETAITDGITRLKQLKPYKFNWKSDTSTIVDGFFAHEVSSIVPDAVFGNKDEVATQANVNSGHAENIGDPIYQKIDHSRLVPLLTAALKEAITKIETLETKVAALEAA